jgi:hypothetical protein
MAIINMGSSYDYANGQRTLRTEFHAGEYCPLPGVNGMNDNRQGDTLYLTHQGLCLADWERNMYDDSDFYMTVWDPVSKSPCNIMFATTRGWSYPCYNSSVDATPEVRAEYNAYMAYKQRRSEVLGRRAARQRDAEVAHRAGLTRVQVERLKAVVGTDYWEGVKRLITSNLRSGFRMSLRQQVMSWINDPAPKFSRPLSPKQMAYL